MNQLVIPSTDGFPLAATLFGELDSGSALVVVAAATAVPQRFYRRFAEFLAERGPAVITFDYRGVGGSKTGALRGFQADFLDWAEKDLYAVTAWGLARARTAVVGHSFGGQAFGLLPNANQTLGLYTFGTGTGWHGHMPLGEWPRVLFLWHVVGPVVTRALGYLPSSRLGLGEDLPLGVYRQWRRWCGSRNHWFADPGADFRERFAGVRAPVLAVNSLDDRWAPPRSAAAFLAAYSGAELTLRSVAPAELGVPAIGHLGYFRTGVGEPLWQQVIEWLRGAGTRSGSGVQ